MTTPTEQKIGRSLSKNGKRKLSLRNADAIGTVISRPVAEFRNTEKALISTKKLRAVWARTPSAASKLWYAKSSETGGVTCWWRQLCMPSGKPSYLQFRKVNDDLLREIDWSCASHTKKDVWALVERNVDEPPIVDDENYESGKRPLYDSRLCATKIRKIKPKPKPKEKPSVRLPFESKASAEHADIADINLCWEVAERVCRACKKKRPADPPSAPPKKKKKKSVASRETSQMWVFQSTPLFLHFIRELEDMSGADLLTIQRRHTDLFIALFEGTATPEHLCTHTELGDEILAIFSSMCTMESGDGAVLMPFGEKCAAYGKKVRITSSIGCALVSDSPQRVGDALKNEKIHETLLLLMSVLFA